MTAPGPPPPPDGDAWDLLVVGAGTAGLVGARTAASLGASVLLVERERPGGDCLWTGCVPSKALLAAAAAAADARAATRLGVHADGVRIAFDEVMAHVRGAVATIEPVDSPAAVRAAGVAYAAGTATFTGATTAEVDGVALRFRQALVATGSDPAVPPIPGLADADPLTSDSGWDLVERPDRLVVLGGGAIGCELGQAFARLGSTVTVVEALDRLLAAEDPDAARLVTEALTRDGVAVRTGSPVTAVERTGPVGAAEDGAVQDGAVQDGAVQDGAGGIRVVLDDGSRIVADRVLVALGRRPDVRGLGLDAAGVALGNGGSVRVDAQLRTTNPRIRAAGDVTGHPRYTHVAGVHGSTAASNAVLGLRRAAGTTAIPRVTYTSPEVAAVGVAAGTPGTTTRTQPHDEVDRAVVEGRTAGFTRLVLDRRGRVVGATVVGPRAGETLAELTLAVRRGLRARDLAGVVHPYPTWGDGPWNAAIAEVRGQLARPAVHLAVRALAAARRRRLDRAAPG